MTKSHVTLEQHICPVCCKQEDSGAILLDRRLRPRFERTTLTGWGLCKEHQELCDKGYVALVVIDEKKSTDRSPNGVWRTGDCAHVKVEVAEKMFTSPIRREDGSVHEVVWISPEVFDMLQTQGSA